MNCKLEWLSLIATTLVLAACGPDNDNPTVSVDDLATGAYVVSVGASDSLKVGKYYAGADGSRLLILNDSNDQANQLYRRNDGSSAWVAVPVTNTSANVSLSQSNAIPTSAVTVTIISGHYLTAISSSMNADFTIAASGDIVAGNSSCKLSGKVSAGTLPGTLKLSLNSSSCGSLPASIAGALIVDNDYAPAAFRLVGDNETQVVDLWAYTE